MHTFLSLYSPFLQPGEAPMPIGNIGWLWVLIFLLVVVIVWSRLVQPVEKPDIHVDHHADEHGHGEEQAKRAAEISIAAPAAAVAQVAPPVPDDLKKIEGIGPKIQTLLNAAGIYTFTDLANTHPARLREILDAANLHIADPRSWPEQARLAAEGNWAEFENLTAALKGGRQAE